jgi:hypothetical protein
MTLTAAIWRGRATGTGNMRSMPEAVFNDAAMIDRDLEELAERLLESEVRIDRQIRLLAELEWSGRAQEARMARELLAAITQCRDLRLMSLRRRRGGAASVWRSPALP